MQRLPGRHTSRGLASAPGKRATWRCDQGQWFKPDDQGRSGPHPPCRHGPATLASDRRNAQTSISSFTAPPAGHMLPQRVRPYRPHRGPDWIGKHTCKAISRFRRAPRHTFSATGQFGQNQVERLSLGMTSGTRFPSKYAPAKSAWSPGRLEKREFTSLSSKGRSSNMPRPIATAMA